MSAISSEKATEYLNRVNWKSLVEWLTAEAILNRPVDPLQYCRDLLGGKLAERGGMDFRPEQITDWLRNCYTEATSLVDENGIIHGKTLEVSNKSLPEQLDDMHRQVDAMQKLLDASKTIANLDPMQVGYIDTYVVHTSMMFVFSYIVMYLNCVYIYIYYEKCAHASSESCLHPTPSCMCGFCILCTARSTQATDNIVGETCRILGCDRATIFTLDAVAKELVLSVAEGAKNIRVPVGQVQCSSVQCNIVQCKTVCFAAALVLSVIASVVCISLTLKFLCISFSVVCITCHVSLCFSLGIQTSE
jgi:hypothetical protein